MESQLSIGMRCVKYLLFLLSFMILCIGVLLVAIGTTLLASYYEFDEFLLHRYLKPVEVVLAVGVITILISFLGCCGAIKGSTVLVNIYSFLLFLLCLLEIATLLTALILRGSVEENIQQNMKIALDDYNKDAGARRTWDITQEAIKCCGINSPLDWKHANVDGHMIHFNYSTFMVPYSCCSAEYCTLFYRKGCWTKLTGYVNDASALLLYSTAVVLVVKFLAVILAWNLAKAIRRNKTNYLLNNYPEIINSLNDPPVSATNLYARY